MSYHWKISTKEYWDFNQSFVLICHMHSIINIVVGTEEICWLWQESISKSHSLAFRRKNGIIFLWECSRYYGQEKGILSANSWTNPSRNKASHTYKSAGFHACIWWNNRIKYFAPPAPSTVGTKSWLAQILMTIPGKISSLQMLLDLYSMRIKNILKFSLFEDKHTSKIWNKNKAFKTPWLLINEQKNTARVKKLLKSRKQQGNSFHWLEPSTGPAHFTVSWFHDSNQLLKRLCGS